MRWAGKGRGKDALCWKHEGRRAGEMESLTAGDPERCTRKAARSACPGPSMKSAVACRLGCGYGYGRSRLPRIPEHCLSWRQGMFKHALRSRKTPSAEGVGGAGRHGERQPRPCGAAGPAPLVVYPLDFEDDRPCTVGAAGVHGAFLPHPAAHDAVSLKACIDAAGYGIPCFGAAGYFRVAGARVRLGAGFDRRVQAARPEMVRAAVPFEEEMSGSFGRR